MSHLRYQGPDGTITPLRFDIQERVEREMNLMEEISIRRFGSQGK